MTILKNASTHLYQIIKKAESLMVQNAYRSHYEETVDHIRRNSPMIRTINSSTESGISVNDVNGRLNVKGRYICYI